MGFRESFQNSKTLFKQSLKILFADKTLLVFPILSLILTVSLFGLFFVPLLGLNLVGIFYGMAYLRQIALLVIIILYFLINYIWVFFTAALVGAAKQSLEGVNTTVGTGLKIAWAHKFQLLKWAFVAATVGVILKNLRRIKGIGRALSAIGGVAWTFINYFIIPVLVFEHLNTKDSIERSKNLFIKTWGTNLIASAGLGLFAVFGFLGTFGLIILFGTAGFIKTTLLLIFVILPALIIFMSTLGAIFNTALYIYASTGRVPPSYSPELIQNAFKRKTT